MKKKMVSSFIFLALVALIFTGCPARDDRIVLRIGDSHPDRTGGVGSVLERINNEFMELHPNVRLAVESLPDQPWQEMVRIYAATNRLPDVFNWWTYPSMTAPFIEAGLVARLDKNDFADFNFLPGALESTMVDGHLYGIPASGDMWVIYVNRSLFEMAGVPLPQTWEDILASVPLFRTHNITPLVTNGLEGWPLSIFFDNIAQRINGDFSRNYNAIARREGVRFTDPDFVQAADFIQTLIRAGVFNANLGVSDYGDARNQFIQERAAMYMMGSWEMGMATNPGFPESFRDSLDVIRFPAIEGGLGTIYDSMFWFGGNFMVSSRSQNLELAIEYIRFLAERFGEYCWEVGAGFPAQQITPRDDDSYVARTLLQFVSDASTISGRAPGLDYGRTAVFKEEHQELMRQLVALLITPEEFTQRLDAAAELDSRQ